MSDRRTAPVCLLMAEDDDDDFLLTQQALADARFHNQLYRVRDGEELLAYLRREGRWSDVRSSPTPELILLDLNMPRMDGREALREIKAAPHLRHLPIVVLTTSNADEDILRSYELGVSSFIRKPVSFSGLVEAVRLLGRYWFELVELPSAETS